MRRNKTGVFKLIVLSAMIITAGLTIALNQNSIMYWFKGMGERYYGLEMVVQTYDTEGQVIDTIQGKSLSITRDTTFDTTKSDSSVMNISIGKNQITHVGSAMIAHETALTDYYTDYLKHVDITNTNKGTPIINNFVRSFDSSMKGRSRLILIRSQHGVPIAAFVGDNIAMYDTKIPKTTGLMIDGHYMVIYRCDYTIYDLALFE